jgi:hypothetical protein
VVKLIGFKIAVMLGFAVFGARLVVPAWRCGAGEASRTLLSVRPAPCAWGASYEFQFVVTRP